VPKSKLRLKLKLKQHAAEGASKRRLPSAAQSGEEAAKVSHPRTPHGHSAEKVHGHGHEHVGKLSQVSAATVSMGKREKLRKKGKMWHERGSVGSAIYELLRW